MKHIYLILAISFFYLTNLNSQTNVENPVIKVDFNVADRSAREVNEPQYTPWAVSQTSKSKTFGKITVSIDKAGDVGSGLITNWYKTTLQAPYFARLANDGVTVAQGDEGGKIALTFSGLNNGKHSLLLYFNSWERSDKAYSPVEISVNNDLKQKVLQSKTVTKNELASKAYFEFEVQNGQDVVILMSAVTTGNEPHKNVCLAGFELNVPNPEHQATNPSPKNLDEHVDADAGKIILSWSAPSIGAESYNVYFGNDSAEVASKTSKPISTKNNNDRTFSINDIQKSKTYFWRVDAIKNGQITYGNVWKFRPRVLAFRGAEGYGMYARGGRGGKVVYVTNLNNDGEGSLRYAIEKEKGARYVLFAVSGKIDLIPGQRISLSDNYVTVAGQTSPDKGICIAKSSFGVGGAQDAVVRFIRLRVGQWGRTADGMGMAGANYSIMDHNSISWSLDEGFSSRNGKNMTLQRTMIAEALNAANHQNYAPGKTHGYAATIGGDTASFITNLLAHCEGRNWSLGGGLNGDGEYWGHLDITNNVVFNYGGRATDGGAHEVNFVNNYYRKGLQSINTILKAQHEGLGKSTQRYYAVGNVIENVDGSFDCTGAATEDSCGCTNEWSRNEKFQYQTFVDKAFFPNHATVLTAQNAYKSVISDCGANMPMLDEHDKRIIDETINKTWKYKGSVTGKWGLPDHHEDVGGYEDYPATALNLDEFDTDRDGLPNWWENEVSHTNPNSPAGDFSDTNSDPENDGSTFIEDYLEWMATPHFETKSGKAVEIELTQFFLGYSDKPHFAAENSDNGKIIVKQNKAKFTSNKNFKGVTYLTITVTDAQGDKMQRRIGIRVN
ncbi:MAG: T9SS C-terminal target domain-containing protein [Paludibacter sp.]|jgi:hypothetical protein|nr:T9SS C-terminal target domain-containing protein [Paludibacter sp.]